MKKAFSVPARTLPSLVEGNAAVAVGSSEVSGIGCARCCWSLSSLDSMVVEVASCVGSEGGGGQRQRGQQKRGRF